MPVTFLILVTLVVGFLCGSTSVGGVLLIPALDACSDLGLRVVMGTVLLSFFFSGLVGTWLQYRAGRIDWRAARPLCLGCLLFGYPGAVARAYVSIPALNVILALAIIVAGVTSLRPVRGRSVPLAPGGDGGDDGNGDAGIAKDTKDTEDEKDGNVSAARVQDAQLFLTGALVSFLSAMTGAGGPVLSVPMMLVLGYRPLMTIAIAQPLQVAVTFSGSIGNMAAGAIDYPSAALMTVLMVAGVIAGVYAVRFFKPDTLKKTVALICVGTGAYMLLATAFAR